MHDYETERLSKEIKSNNHMNKRVRDLVNKKVIILEFPRDSRWECCTLDLVLYRNLDIFSAGRSGFTYDDVHHLGKYKAYDGEIVPVIYLKADRPQTTLTKKEVRELIKHMETS